MPATRVQHSIRIGILLLAVSVSARTPADVPDPLSTCRTANQGGVAATKKGAGESVMSMEHHAGLPVTVCAYNIYEGAAQPERRRALAAFLRTRVFGREEPREQAGEVCTGGTAALAALTECNGWDQAFAERFARECGAKYAVLLNCPTGYHMAILSSHDLRVITKRTGVCVCVCVCVCLCVCVCVCVYIM